MSQETTEHPARRRPCLLTAFALVVAVAGVAPVRAQISSPEGLPLSACDLNLASTISIQGLNAAWETAKPLSSKMIPAFGYATGDMASAIDATVGNYMNEFGIPGGAVALTYKDQLIFARSYGYMNSEDEVFAEPDSRYRMASVSKPITAMGILKLVHDGKLKLTDTPFPFADLPPLIGGTPGNLFPHGTFNQKLSLITVGELLHHAGGWNRDIAPDLTGYPILQALASFATSMTGTPSGPPDCNGLLSYVETQPLQFKPGTKTHYSNVGFCALSEVIRETSGMSFSDYLTANVLDPLGMNDTDLGSTPQGLVQDREATYYDTTDPDQPSLFPPYSVVTAPYSSIGALESLSGAGGIVSTAIDLARFAGAIAGGRLKDLPGGATYPGWPTDYYTLSSTLPNYECSNSIPPYPLTAKCKAGWSDAWEKGHWAFGAGWDSLPPNAVPTPLLPYDNYNFIKDGGYPGTVSSMAATADGYGFGAVFNANDNTAPAPENEIFWPSCNSGPPPQPAASSANCALQAAYNHTASTPWSVNFLPQYNAPYSAWMSPVAFVSFLKAQKALGRYPSRLEGREPGPGVTQYRARMGKQPMAPQYVYGQSCASVLSGISSAPASTPLVSLQRFIGPGGTYVYQAVWSTPLP